MGFLDLSNDTVSNFTVYTHDINSLLYVRTNSDYCSNQTLDIKNFGECYFAEHSLLL